MSPPDHDNLLRTLRGAAVCAAALCAASGALAQQGFDYVPHDIRGLDVVEQLDQTIPLDLTFTDDAGRQVRLGDYFNNDKPVILTLNYYMCPMICTQTLNGMVEALKDIDWSPGDEYSIVTVSINPKEDHELAAAKKQSYVTFFDREGVQEGWHFLTGPGANSKALADATGFGYRYLEDSGEYAHPAVIFIVTPDGRMSRYLYGLTHTSTNLRYALLEASDGKIGNTLDRFLLWCHKYDPEKGTYTKDAMVIMRLSGAATIAILATGLGLLWLRGTRAEQTSINHLQVEPS